MTSFTASPNRITEGDTFTLTWTAPCGYVSVAQRGQPPFLVLRQSNDSYQLKPGTGYPTAAGDTVYEAKNGDTATPLSTTVTMNPKATPTPAGPPTVSLSPAGATSCHPKKASNVVTACSVGFNASATNYTSLDWSGCCAGSSGTTGNCQVNAIQGFTCSVTATGAGGTASANGTATGINSSPNIGGNATYDHGVPLPLNSVVWANYDATEPDGDGFSCVKTFAQGGSCGSYDTCGLVFYGVGKVRFDTNSPASTCCWAVQWKDEWGALKNSPQYCVDTQ